jgi:hypothetical protein
MTPAKKLKHANFCVSCADLLNGVGSALAVNLSRVVSSSVGVVER